MVARRRVAELRRHAKNAMVQEEGMLEREAAKEVMKRLVLRRGEHFPLRLLGDGGELMLGAKFPQDQLGPLQGADELLGDFALEAEGWHQFDGV